MKRSILLFVAFAFVAESLSAQSWVHGLAVSAPFGQVFYGKIADFNLCRGQTITAIYSLIDWGDSTGITTGEFQDPLYMHSLLGSHTYKAANTYTINIRVVGTCYRDAGDLQQWWGDSASGSAVATVVPEVPVATITLSPTTVTRGTTATATVSISSSAPNWGTLVQIASSDPTAATVAPGVLVVSGKTTTLTINTLPFAGGARNVTITAVSGGASASAILRVK